MEGVCQRVVQEQANDGRAFHIINPNPFPASGLFDMVQSAGVAIVQSPYEEWRRMMPPRCVLFCLAKLTSQARCSPRRPPPRRMHSIRCLHTLRFASAHKLKRLVSGQRAWAQETFAMSSPNYGFTHTASYLEAVNVTVPDVGSVIGKYFAYLFQSGMCGRVGRSQGWEQLALTTRVAGFLEQPASPTDFYAELMEQGSVATEQVTRSNRH